MYHLFLKPFFDSKPVTFLHHQRSLKIKIV